MFDDLKPCPFCGGKAALYVNDGVSVICPKCEASTRVLRDMICRNGVVGNATKSVIEAWNRRYEGGK
jgi:Lar family restriction alleviation protein